MTFASEAQYLRFSAAAGLYPQQSSWEMPDWVRQAVDDAADGAAFDRAMALAGADCIESYGMSIEHMDVWALPEHAGWLVVHDDGNRVDALIFVEDLPSYMTFQTIWIAPMAHKIMESDEYYFFRKEVEESLESEPKIH